MRRYYSFNRYLKETFPGLRVYKIPIDAGFTCPNRDGKVATGGCIYCINRSFSPNTRLESRPSIKEQIQRGMDFFRRHYQAQKFIAYFQAFTNTYDEPGRLKSIYDEILSFPDMVGLAIGTRPDCVSEEILSLISTYTRKYLVWIEYGVQSSHNKTLQLINRGHSYEDFVKAVEITRSRGIKIATHIILGLPGETRADMLTTTLRIGQLGLDGIKIHHLYVARNTPLEKWYNEGKVKVMTLAEYLRLVCDCLERLPENMVIQRLLGELSDESVLAPKWGKSKGTILNLIEKELARRGSYQGRLFPKCAGCLPQTPFARTP